MAKIKKTKTSTLSRVDYSKIPKGFATTGSRATGSRATGSRAYSSSKNAWPTKNLFA